MACSATVSLVLHGSEVHREIPGWSNQPGQRRTKSELIEVIEEGGGDAPPSLATDRSVTTPPKVGLQHGELAQTPLAEW